jgi:hypothetical protein
MATLDTELNTYKRLLPSLLAEPGKFAVIHGDELVGTYSAYDDALKVGYEKCGIKPFLVKRISAEESAAYFSRDLGKPCSA